MKYEVIWKTEKVIIRAGIVMDYWNNVAIGAKETLVQLSQAEREDKTHTGAPAKLKRIMEAAKGQAWRAQVLLIQAKDTISENEKRIWTWNNDDLLWFYPELVNNEDRLL